MAVIARGIFSRTKEMIVMIVMIIAIVLDSIPNSPLIHDSVVFLLSSHRDCDVLVRPSVYSYRAVHFLLRIQGISNC